MVALYEKRTHMHCVTSEEIFKQTMTKMLVFPSHKAIIWLEKSSRNHNVLFCFLTFLKLAVFVPWFTVIVRCMEER